MNLQTIEFRNLLEPTQYLAVVLKDHGFFRRLCCFLLPIINVYIDIFSVCKIWSSLGNHCTRAARGISIFLIAAFIVSIELAILYANSIHLPHFTWYWASFLTSIIVNLAFLLYRQSSRLILTLLHFFWPSTMPAKKKQPSKHLWRRTSLLPSRRSHCLVTHASEAFKSSWPCEGRHWPCSRLLHLEDRLCNER